MRTYLAETYRPTYRCYIIKAADDADATDKACATLRGQGVEPPYRVKVTPVAGGLRHGANCTCDECLNRSERAFTVWHDEA